MTFQTYLKINGKVIPVQKDDYSIDYMNAKYRCRTEKCFQEYYRSHRSLIRGIDPKVEKAIIQGTKRRVLNEGVLLEGFTFDDWIRHIEELE